MKKTLNIFALALTLLIAQACGPKSEKSEEVVAEETAAETPVVTEPTIELTVAEKRAKLAEQRAAREEKRRIAFEERAKISPTYKDSKGRVVYNKAEVDPSFQGGNKAMEKYLRDNIKFPEAAKDKGVEGVVFVDFVIAADGSVEEVVVTDDTNEDVDQSFRDEAIRVVSGMPKWVPGRQRGKAVDVKFSVPISFEMM